jgi:hypothetical protein
VHEDPTKRHGAAYLAQQASLQMDKISKQASSLGRVHPKSLKKFESIRANAKNPKADSHRPQERYKWMEVAWNETYPYAEQLLHAAVKRVYVRLAAIKKDTPVITKSGAGQFMKGLRLGKTTIPKRFSSSIGGQK